MIKSRSWQIQNGMSDPSVTALMVKAAAGNNQWFRMACRFTTISVASGDSLSVMCATSVFSCYRQHSPTIHVLIITYLLSGNVEPSLNLRNLDVLGGSKAIYNC